MVGLHAGHLQDTPLFHVAEQRQRALEGVQERAGRVFVEQNPFDAGSPGL